MILYNGNIITIDQKQPRAQAVAIANGRFAAVGTNDDIRAGVPAGAQSVDLGGRTVVPGFIDAHSHPASAGLSHLQCVDCDLRSIDEITDAIRVRASKTAPGEWVLGFKYDDTKTKEGRFLTRDDLDRAAPDHPVFITHRGGHSHHVNTIAYERAGITSETPDPPGGRLERDPDTGRLNGRVLELAARPFRAEIPNEITRDDYREGVKLISQMLARAGITSVHDAYTDSSFLRAYQDARQADELLTRVYCMIGYTERDRIVPAGVRTGLGDEWVRIGGMKALCDGSISERTARLSEPYIGRPDDFGIVVADEEELYDQLSGAYKAGWQVGVHANGDVGIDITLSVYERLHREAPRPDPRFRVEHCTVINDSILERMKALNAIPNPFSTYVYFHGEKMKEYGEERLNSMFAVRTFLDAGLMVTQTSDYPPGPFEPMMALRSNVTRTDMNGKLWGPDQRITVEEALRVGTLHGAYASYEENLKGSIEPEKLADLVVLGEDPTVVDPMALIDIPIERTMVGGEWVYES
jgi:predicted amidohydrolase YtcJ